MNLLDVERRSFALFIFVVQSESTISGNLQKNRNSRMSIYGRVSVITAPRFLGANVFGIVSSFADRFLAPELLNLNVAV